MVDSTTSFGPYTSLAAPQPIQRRKLAHQVLGRLLSLIGAGDFPVNTLLPSERELMQLFGVGRPAVREALQSLERMGLISIVHGEGARVLPLSAHSVIAQISDTAVHMLSGSETLLEHLKEARLMFEVGMARIAAQNATKDDIEALRQVLEAHRASARDPHRFLETDMAFHRAIAAVSGNPIFVAVAEGMLQWLQRFRTQLVRAPGAELATLAEHEKLFKCIEDHDPDAAAETVTGHLTRANKLYRLASKVRAPAVQHTKAGPGGEVAQPPKRPRSRNRD